MLCPLLLWSAGRMERVGQKKKSSDEIRFFCTKHAGLATAVGVASKEHPRFFSRNVRSCHNFPQYRNCILQASAITGGICRTRGTKGSDLPEGKIAADDREPCLREGVRQCTKQRCLSVTSGTMCEHQTVAVRNPRRVQEPANVRLNGRFGEVAAGWQIQANILNGCL